MRLDYAPQYRDDTEAATARFPGDAVNPRAPGAPVRLGARGWIGVALVVTLAALVFASRRRARSALWDALVQADLVDHPVFVAGVVLAAIGSAMVLLPIVYLLGVRRSTRPVIEQTVRVNINDSGIAVRMPAKELNIAWDGVVSFAETRNLFVLKTVGDLRLALPKRAAPDFGESLTGINDLRDLLRRRVAPIAATAVASQRLAA